MRRAARATLLLTFLVALCAAPAGAATIGISPTASSAGVGESVEIQLTVSGLGDGAAPSLSVFDLDLLFDPALLAVSSVAYGDPILGDQLDLDGFGPVTATMPAGPGALNLFELSLDAPATLDADQAAAFVLATVELTTLAAGTSVLGIDVIDLGDAFGNPLPAEVMPGELTIGAAVPEPTSLVLFPIGLLAVRFARRRAR